MLDCSSSERRTKHRNWFIIAVKSSFPPDRHLPINYTTTALCVNIFKNFYLLHVVKYCHISCNTSFILHQFLYSWRLTIDNHRREGKGSEEVIVSWKKVWNLNLIPPIDMKPFVVSKLSIHSFTTQCTYSLLLQFRWWHFSCLLILKVTLDPKYTTIIASFNDNFSLEEQKSEVRKTN